MSSLLQDIGLVDSLRIYSIQHASGYRLICITSQIILLPTDLPTGLTKSFQPVLGPIAHLAYGCPPSRHLHRWMVKTKWDPAERVLLFPDDLDIVQGAGVVALTSSTNWRHERRVVIHIPCFARLNRAYPQELLSPMCGEMLGVLLITTNKPYTIYSDCKPAPTKTLSRRRKRAS